MAQGAQATLSVTFDQETAADHPKALHLSVMHPLVRQAAGFLDIAQPKYCTLTARSGELPPGTHHFALYRWAKHGIKADELLVAIADEPRLEASLFTLLESASEAGAAPLPDMSECDALDVRHHAKWSEAQANHIAENRELAEHRVQSLSVSHRARCKIIEDQLSRATNDKIRLMKESELARADADFNRRIEELQQAANSGDIRTTPVVFGTLLVAKGGDQG